MMAASHSCTSNTNVDDASASLNPNLQASEEGTGEKGAISDSDVGTGPVKEKLPQMIGMPSNRGITCNPAHAVIGDADLLVGGVMGDVSPANDRITTGYLDSADEVERLRIRLARQDLEIERLEIKGERLELEAERLQLQIERLAFERVSNEQQ